MGDVEGGAARFRSLVVSGKDEIATGIHRFELRDPHGDALPEFFAGAHLSIRVPNGLTRKYSLCNDPAERDRYVIAVLRDAAGHGGSLCLCDDTRAGMTLDCAAPRNDFPLAERAPEHLFIAGGIGITPIMAMLRHLKRRGNDRFRLYYCTRTPDATAFRDELGAEDFRAHVVFHHDGGDPGRMLDLWPLLEKPAGAHLYCCGPRPMLEAVRDMTGHWSSAAVHFESFVDATRTHAGTDRPFRVRLARSGEIVSVAADQSILEALRMAGHLAASSCESGTCGTCRTGLVGGEPEHRDLVLAADEQAGSIMICVSRARSDELVLDL